MKNDYKNMEKLYKPNYFKKFSGHPLSGYVILSLVLIVLQLLFMFTDGIISLTVSRAIATTMVYTVAAMGMGILLNLAGLTSLGTAAFIGLGAYLAGNILKAFALPYMALLLCVAVTGVVLGTIIGFISLRVRGLHLLIITLAFASILNELFMTPNNFTGGPAGLSRVPYPELAMFINLNRETVFFLILAVMFILIIITLNIINSPTGRAMMAMSNSESLAQAMGVRILKYRVLAFVIATVYAMISGVLYISMITAANPSSWSLMLSLNLLAAVILGGTAKPAGVIMGSTVIFCLDLAILKNIPFFQKYSSASTIFSGILIILIVVKYPGGLMRLLHDVRDGIEALYTKWRVYRYGPEV